jgi:O-methyltransferase
MLKNEATFEQIYGKALRGDLPFEAMCQALETIVEAKNFPVAFHFYQTWTSSQRGRIRVSQASYDRAVPVWEKLREHFADVAPLPQSVDWLRFNLNGKMLEYRDIDDPFFMDIIDRVHKHTITMLEGVEPPWEMYKAIEYIVRNNIPGDLVECGVWNGGSILLMALALQHFGDTSRKIYLYDTFEGMPAPQDVDRNWDGVPALPTWEAKKISDPNGPNWGFGGTVEMVQEVVYSSGYPRENFMFVKGMVEDTLPDQMPQEVSLLRLDTDFYSSTYHELVHLYPALTPGGVLIIDDYGYFQGARIATDQYLEEQKLPLFLSRVTQSVRLAIKPGQFHS